MRPVGLLNTTEVVGGDSEIWKWRQNNLKWVKPTGGEVPLWWLLLSHHVFAGWFDSLLTQHMDQWGRLEPEYPSVFPGYVSPATLLLLLSLSLSAALCSSRQSPRLGLFTQPSLALLLCLVIRNTCTTDFTESCTQCSNISFVTLIGSIQSLMSRAK